jgi:ribosomal protein S18 acetylase RimI-like enzyme
MTDGPAVVVAEVPGSVTADLRRAVLRSGPAAAAPLFDNDVPGALYLAATVDGVVVGCGTFLPEPLPDDPDGRSAWRLRGMATDPAWHGQGVGRAVLTDGLARAAAAGVDLMWCNARTSALGFYRRMGFETVGEEFVTETGIPHYRALRRVPGAG